MGNTDTGVCSDIGNTNPSIHPVSYCPIWDEAVLIPDLTSVSATLAQTADEDAATFVSPVFSQAKEVLGTAARHDHLSSTLPPFAWDDNTACSILRTARTSSSTSAAATRTHSADEDTAAFVSPVSSRDREALGPAARHDHLGMTAPPFSWEEAPCATGAP